MTRFALILILFLSVCGIGAFASNVTETSPAALSEQGIAAYQRGDYLRAIKLLNERSKMVPDDPNIYYYLGHCYVRTNQNDQAAHMYSTCIRKSPGSQAGQYALKALESLSTTQKSAPDSKQGNSNKAQAQDPTATEVSRDSLMSEAALDMSFNEAVQRIKNSRQTHKTRVDRLYEQLHDDLDAINPSTTPNYAGELERTRREIDIKVEDTQIKELRYENRLLAPDKIDVRAVPQLPQEKADDTKPALGSLFELLKPEKPFDPFATDITPDISAKFMSIKDVFGELSTYQPSAQRMAKQAFMQLKSRIEMKQDQFDQQIYQDKNNLIRDIVNIYANSSNYGLVREQLSVNYHIKESKVPRSDQSNLSSMQIELSETTDRTKKRIRELEDSYYRDVDSLITGARERVGAMVAQVGQMNNQLKHPSGTIQLVPQGTDTYTRNYINFGDHFSPDAPDIHSTPQVKPISAQRGKLLLPKPTEPHE